MNLELTIKPEEMTTSGINQLAGAICEQVINQIPNDAVRYAIIKSLESAAKNALTPCIKQSATRAAELAHENIGHVGAEVVLEGLTFQVKHTLSYDYSRVRGWAAACREIDKQEKALSVLKLRKKAIENEADLRLKPIDDKVSIAFIPK